jgi:plasmid stability protein
MAQVVIRNIDEAVMARLRARAAVRRKPLEQALRDILTEAARPTREELVAEMRAIRAMTPRRRRGAKYPSAEQMVRDDRDAR